MKDCKELEDNLWDLHNQLYEELNRALVKLRQCDGYDLYQLVDLIDQLIDVKIEIHKKECNKK